METISTWSVIGLLIVVILSILAVAFALAIGAVIILYALSRFEEWKGEREKKQILSAIVRDQPSED